MCSNVGTLQNLDVNHVIWFTELFNSLFMTNALVLSSPSLQKPSSSHKADFLFLVLESACKIKKNISHSLFSWKISLILEGENQTQEQDLTYHMLIMDLFLPITLIPIHCWMYTAAVLGRLPGTTVYRNVQQYPEAYTYNGIVIVRIDAPIYFANISYIKDR